MKNFHDIQLIHNNTNVSSHFRKNDIDIVTYDKFKVRARAKSKDILNSVCALSDYSINNTNNPIFLYRKTTGWIWRDDNRNNKKQRK